MQDMYFFRGRLGALERMMTEKPGFYRRNAKSGKPKPHKQSPPKRQAESRKEVDSDE